MATLVINNIGGVFPAILARNLPDTGAQKAENLLARTPEFRPLADDSNASTAPAGTQTLYRFARKDDGTFNSDPSTGWLTSTSYISYVKGQLDDDAKERTYYTYNDGSAAPRARDVTGADRVLGVPAPAKLSGLLTVVDEFTTEERTAGIDAITVEAEEILADNITTAYTGMTSPGTGTAGLVDWVTLDPSRADPGHVLRVFRLSSTTGTLGAITNTYSSMPVETASWVTDPRLGGYIYTGNNSLSWAGGNYDHVAVPLPVYAKGFTFDSTAAAADLATLQTPGTSSPLLTGSQITELMNYINDQINPAGQSLKPKFDALKAKAADVLALFNGDASAVSKAEVQSFYTSVAQSVITSETNSFAEAIFLMASNIATAEPFVDSGGGGAAAP